MFKRFDIAPFMLLGCAAFLASCSDEPTQPTPSSSLVEADLVESPSGGEFLDIAFASTSDRGLAVGSVASGLPPNQTYTPLVAALDPSGAWTADANVASPPTGLLTAVGLTPSGDALIAGVDASLATGFILDERNGWSTVDVAFGGRSFFQSGDTLRVAGAAGSTQQVFISTAPDSWTPEALPYPVGQNERAIVDASAASGTWAACGFDDSGDGSPASPDNVLFLNHGLGWERISVACGGCSNREFRSVVVAPTGGILLGGAITNFAGGANEYTASLALRAVSGDWVEIVLPKPTELKRVNDLLIAHDGTVYMACGMGGSSYLMRWSNSGPITREATLTSARINRLGESADGRIWAAGAVLDAEGNVVRPAIWKRTG